MENKTNIQSKKIICCSVEGSHTFAMSMGPTTLVVNTSTISRFPVSARDPGMFTPALLMIRFRPLPFSLASTSFEASAILARLSVSFEI